MKLKLTFTKTLVLRKRFLVSNYSTKSIKLLIGRIEDKPQGVASEECVGLKPKMETKITKNFTH